MRTKCMIPIFILVLFFIASVQQSTFAINLFPTKGATREEVTISFSGTPLEFANKPFVINGEVMIPTRTFFERINAQVHWNNAIQTFVAYKDNTFLKFKVGDSLAYINGKATPISVQPFIHNGTLYVPLSAAAGAFGLNFDHVHADQWVSVDYREPVYQYMTMGFHHYKRIQLLNLGISFYIPEFWDALDEDITQFGFITPFDDYVLDVTVLPLDNTFSRSSLFDILKNNLELEHGDSLEVLETRTSRPGEYIANALYYTTQEEELLIYHALYVFFENNIGYVFSGSYSEANDLIDARTIYDTIISTFRISKLSINEHQEHYVEFNAFFDYGLTLIEPIHSNIMIDNTIHFKGTVASEDVRGLKVAVAKDGQRTDFYIPVINQRFDGFAFAPFGLGKHNVTLVLDIDNQVSDLPMNEAHDFTSLESYVNEMLKSSFNIDQEAAAMKFSVVNTSSEPIRDLLPSQFVNYDTPEVYATVHRVTFNLTSEYAKTLALYEWIVKNYAFTSNIPESGILSVEQMIQANEGNALELSVLYAGLIRALDIPARIVRGQNDDGVAFWVETYINGRWLIADIVKEIITKPEELEPSTDYFNLNRTLHYNQFNVVDVLPF